MTSAILWGLVAASSLLIGALLGMARKWPDRLVGGVLAFGGGALIASIAFELAEESVTEVGPIPTAIGLALGAATYFTADRMLEGGNDAKGAEGDPGASGHRAHNSRRARRHSGLAGLGGPGLVLAMGAFLDGIPEQAVLGIQLAGGGGVGIPLLVAIFVSNLPEGIGSAADMRAGGASRGRIVGTWLVVSLACAAATVLGCALADFLPPAVVGGVNGFAAGALLVMLVDSLFPEAREKMGRWAGVLTACGFALGAGLSLLA